MASILHIISIIALILAIISTILAVVIWFKLKIPAVYGDLSGKTARKNIQQMYEKNDNADKRKHKEKEKISIGIKNFRTKKPKKRVDKDETVEIQSTITEKLNISDGSDFTEPLDMNWIETEDSCSENIISDAGKTETLNSNGTEILPVEGTEVLDFDGTEPLHLEDTEDVYSEGTEVLEIEETVALETLETDVISDEIEVIDEEYLIHTDEKI